MKPYFETELGKLYHGDCLEIIPKLEPVDLVLTDPPYGISYDASHKKYKNGIARKEADWDTKPFIPTHIINLNVKTILWGGNCFASKLPGQGHCWMNPPYDKTIGNWMQKAYNSAQNGATVVCLLPGRSSDTKWFHRYVMKASEIRYVKGRLQFLHNGKVGGNSNISNLVIVFRPYCVGPPVVSNIDRQGRPIISRCT